MTRVMFPCSQILPNDAVVVLFIFRKIVCTLLALVFFSILFYSSLVALQWKCIFSDHTKRIKYRCDICLCPRCTKWERKKIVMWQKANQVGIWWQKMCAWLICHAIQFGVRSTLFLFMVLDLSRVPVSQLHFSLCSCKNAEVYVCRSWKSAKRIKRKSIYSLYTVVPFLKSIWHIETVISFLDEFFKATINNIKWDRAREKFPIWKRQT